MTVQQSAQPPLTRRELRERERAVERESTQSIPVVEAAPEAAASLPEHQLTRRELRALLEAQGKLPVADDEVHAAAPPPPPVERVAPEPAEPVKPADVSKPAEPSLEPRPLDKTSTVAVETQGASTTVSEPPAPSADARRLFQPPTGHWSREASKSFDEIISVDPDEAHSRSLESSGASGTVNALIIPNVPSVADVTAPLNATGEIMLTGSIDLPRSFAETGQFAKAFDGTEIDRAFDQAETGVSPGGATPVSAARAVSTHVPSRSMIAPPKNRGTRLPTVLAASAGVLALAVAGLLAAGFGLHIF